MPSSVHKNRFGTMVIQTSNSCNTLVSLDEFKKDSTHYDTHNSRDLIVKYQKTNLLLPADLFQEDDDEDDSFYGSSDQHVYLPSSGPVDRYLRGVPQLMETADELLANSHKVLNASSPQRIISVGQGEVAHCTPAQTDVLVSDKATTCHVIFFKSTCGDTETTLASCTHLDSVHYESCVRGILAEHEAYHSSSYPEEEKKHQNGTCNSKINMDIHILGGFDDEDSREISSWLLRLLGELSIEYQTIISMRLQTCAVSSMNDDGRGSPMGRGLAMNLKTGTVFLAKVDASVAGPMPVLRAARLWSGTSGKRLTVIHSSLSQCFSIPAFSYTSMPDLNTLLQLPDDILLQYTSTSPHVEEHDFCSSVRSTLTFMNSVKCESIFSSSRSLRFTRVGLSNQWRLKA